MGSGKSLQAQVQLHHEAAHCNTYSEGTFVDVSVHSNQAHCNTVLHASTWMSLCTQIKQSSIVSYTSPFCCYDTL